MTIFKLQQFPYVCRLCLQPDPHDKMVPLSNSDEVFEGTIGDFIASFTFVIAESKSHFFPQTVCGECLEMLKFFGKYRSKVLNVHLFMNSLVELKLSNRVPIEDLFMNKQVPLNMLFKDLGLCSKKNPEVAELINEFGEYKIASIASIAKEEVKAQEELPQLISSDDEIIFQNEPSTFATGIYYEECTPDELLNNKINPEILNNKANPEKNNKLPKEKVKRKRIDKTITIDDCEGLQDSLLIDADNFDSLESITAIKKKYGGPKLDVPLRCDKCKFQTFRLRNFKSHQVTHLKREFKIRHCMEEGCSEKFNSKAELRSHRGTKHKMYICETCGYRTGFWNILQQHKQRHLNVPSYSCQYCQKQFCVQNDLRVHIDYNHLAVSNFECKTCGLQFKRNTTLKNHELTHVDAYDFHCDKCDSKFKTKRALSKHTSKVHSQPTQTCPYCEMAYHCQYKLHNHIEGVHHVRVRFVCDICVAVFYSQESMDIHASRHKNPKELECATCLWVSKSQEQLDGHMCITYRDDYVCCGRDQRHFQIYNNHMFLKHGLRTNVRVKPDPNMLLGEMRAKRKRVESCSKCEQIFPTRKAKRCHMETCAGAVESMTTGAVESITTGAVESITTGAIESITTGAIESITTGAVESITTEAVEA